MKSGRIAIIDCGTNTFNLLIAARSNNRWKFLLRRKKVVKLGSDGIVNGMIGDAPAERAVLALIDYRKLTDEKGVKEVRIVGTAALRDAKNGKTILRRIYDATGFSIQLIDGLQEAALIWKGVRQAIPLGDDSSLVMDIGGGSTEFILCNAHKIFWKKSFRLGAARIKELHPFSDPPTAKEIKKLEEFLKQELAPLADACLRYPPKRLIGSSGSFDSFTAMILKKKNEPAFRGTHYHFNLKEYVALHRELVRTSYQERLQFPGLLRMRADMIVPASVLLTFALRFTGIKEMHLSTYSLKEGLLDEFN
jgi:exopolyphosphatase/guanosine-5'-triphosphate,3'-diphosphate pyrophosphatase